MIVQFGAAASGMAPDVTMKRTARRRPAPAKCAGPRPVRRRPAPRPQPILAELEPDQLGGLWGAIKKVAKKAKKAVSIKNVVKVTKKAAPIAALVATGGTAGLVGIAAKKVGGSLLSKFAQKLTPASAEKVASIVPSISSAGGLLKKFAPATAARIEQLTARPEVAAFVSTMQQTAELAPTAVRLVQEGAPPPRPVRPRPLPSVPDELRPVSMQPEPAGGMNLAVPIAAVAALVLLSSRSRS